MLQGKITLVTGAGSGIGQAIALAFAQQGAFVWLVDRDEKAGKATAMQLRAAGQQGEFAQLDIANEADVFALISTDSMRSMSVGYSTFVRLSLLRCSSADRVA